MENTNYCQSCGMPLVESEGLFGTNVDGSTNPTYCIHCFKEGHFTYDCSLEEMIETCIPFTLEAEPTLSEEKAREMLSAFIPTLERWK